MRASVIVLLEREEALAALDAAKTEAVRGRGSVVLVAGDAGIGKTSLLEEFRSRPGRRSRVLWSSCDALFTPRPLGPVFELAYSFDAAIGEMLEQGSASTKLFAAIVRELEAAPKATVLTIEDVHWADVSTLDFVLYVGKRIAMLPAMLVLSLRNDEIGADHPMRKVAGDLPQANLRRIELQPLSRDAVALLCSGSRIDGDEVHAVSGGNPFFVTELIAAGSHRAEDVPASVQDAVGARLARLGESEQHFLETIAVIPGPVRPELVTAMFGPEGDTWAMACVGRKILMQDASGSLRFRHELARLATLARTTATQQRDNHRRALEAYERIALDPGIDQRVHHAAGAFDAARVLSLAPRAAARAARVGSHREAAAHFRTALDFVDEAAPELAASLYEGWAYEAGLAERIDDDVIAARQHALTLWRALERPEKVGENLRWLSRLHWYRGESGQAQRFADEAVRILETAAPSGEKAMAYSLRSQLHMLNDRMEEAIHWGEKAIAAATEFDNLDARVHALNNVGTAKAFRGDASGVDLLRESLRLAIENDFHEHAARVYTNLSEYAVEFRQLELAEDIMSEGIAFDTRHDLDSWTHYLVGRQAQLRLEQGRLQDAAIIADGVMRLPKLTMLMKLPALTVLARARLRLGEDDAPERLAEALAQAIEVDEVQYIVPARLGRVEAAWQAGDVDAARKELQLLARNGSATMHVWHIGEVAAWATRLDYPLDDWPADGLPAPFALEIDGDVDAAAAAWLEIGAPYAAVLAMLAATQAVSVERLRESIRICRKIAARAGENKARALADAAGLSKEMPRRRRGPYGASRNHPLGLTRREQQILQLICAGHSNVRIARKLSRSKKTVEHHVSSVFRKMKVANRTEAVLRVQSEPWLIAGESAGRREK